MNYELQKLKMQYIPMFARGEITERECARFTLCLSESFGLRAYMGGRYYDVELAEPITDCVGDSMPIVEKELIYRYFYADTHSGRATIRAG